MLCLLCQRTVSMPLVSVDHYSKIKVQIVLYGSELWNNITNADMSAISQFHNKAVKRLQCLPIHTRSDMAESMVGLNRLPSRIESRKLQFLHKSITLPAGSVSRDIIYENLYFLIMISHFLPWDMSRTFANCC